MPLRCLITGVLSVAASLMVGILPESAQAQIGKEWRLRTPLPTAEYLGGVASISGRIVVAGGAGTVLNSADGASWAAQRVGREKFQSVASSGTTLLATSGGGNVWLSTDGLAWAPQTVNLPDQTSLGIVIWDGQRWVAFNDNYNSPQSLLVSTDGANWTKFADLPANDSNNGTRYINALISTGTRYVVVGGTSGTDTPYVATTSDGTDWQEVSLGDFSATTGNQVRDVVWTGSGLVLVGTNDMVFTSPDGANWTKQTMTSGGKYVSAVTWTGTQLVAFSRNFGTGGEGTTYTAPADGAMWTGTAAPDFGSFAITKATWTGSQVVAVDDSGGLFTSPTGSTFTRRLPTSGTTARIDVVAASPAGLLALDDAGNALKSATGETWTATATTGLSNELSNTVSEVFQSRMVWAPGASKWVVAGGINRSILSSGNGLDWTVQVVGGLRAGYSAIAEHAGTLVAVGRQNGLEGPPKVTILTSLDGGAWSAAKKVPDVIGFLNDVTWSGSRWVAVGQGSLVLTSTDAQTWTRQNLTGAGTIYSVACSGTLVVAVSDNGSLTSPNGTTWTQHPWSPQVLKAGGKLNRVLWTGSNFLSVRAAASSDDFDNEVATSYDGVNWTEQDKGSDNAFNDIALDTTNHQVVAVGQNGMVMTSDAVPSVQFSQSGQSTLEGNGLVLVTVQLGFAVTTPVTVSLAAGGTALGGTDYTPVVPASVIFNPGETMKALVLKTVPNGTTDAEKNILLTLGSPTGARLGGITAQSIRIIDNHTPPPVSFAHDGFSAGEDAGTVNVEVDLGWASADTVTVAISTSGGTATADTDFTGVPSMVTFAPGERRKMIPVTIADDVDEEPDESVVLTLSSPTNATLGETTGFTLTILDNDPADQTGRNWALRNPLPTSEGLNGIAATSGIQVIVGNHGLVLTSSNQGVAWAPVLTGSTANYAAVTRTQSSFVAVGGGGHVMISPDGSAWFEQKVKGTGRFDFLGVGDGGASGTVATGAITDEQTGQSVPVVYFTSDGQNWNERPVPETAQGAGQGVARSPTTFVIVGGGYSSAGNGFQTLIMTSPDGLVWTDRSGAVSGVWFKDVVWKGDKFLAVDGTAKTYTSIDGVNWSPKVAGSLGGLSAVTFDGVSKTVAVGNVTASGINNAAGVITEHPSGTPVTLVDVAYTGSTYIAVGGSGTIMTSTDGDTWTRSPASKGVDQSGGQGNGFVGVTWSGTQFLAVGGVHPGSALAATSADGVTWTPRPVAGADVLLDVTWSGTQFAAVGPGGVIKTSPDGVTWAARTSGVKLDLHKILWAAGQFVAVGGNDPGEVAPADAGSVVLTSPNGTSWTRRAIPTAQPLEGIVFTGHLLVATGRRGELLTSPDAINWTLQDSGITSGGDLGPIAWNGSLLVTGTADLEIISSPDGVTWTPASSVPDLHLKHSGDALGGAVWTGSQFVITSHEGAILTSPDGDVWKAQNSHTGNDLRGVCTNGSTVVIVGLNSTILTSGDGPPPPPQVQFADTQSTVNEGATANLLVTMSSPPTVKTTVPFTLDYGSTVGTASAPDVIPPPVLSLVFNPGETAKFITIPTKQDTFAEGDEVLPVTLIAPVAGATLGTTQTHSLTIKDDDVAPSITLQPQHQLVAVGEPLALVSAASGTGKLLYQWSKDSKPIKGATQQVYYVPSSTLGQAGEYMLRVTSVVGTAVSDTVQVGVYDGSHHSSVVAKDAASVPFVQTAAGKGLSYQWVDDSDMPIVEVPGHLVIADNTLTISKVALADAKQYKCRVLQAASSLLDNGARFQLNVVSAAPSFTSASLVLPTGGTVGVPYSASVASSLSPGSFATFSASGLPAGLFMDAFGTVTGIPTAAVKNKAITITAKNAVGGKSIPATITILAQPTGFAGIWNGLVDRNPDVNNGLGSLVQLSVSSAGSFTGKLISGATTTSVVGGALEIAMDGKSAAGTATTALGAGRSLQVTFTIDTTVVPVVLKGTVAIGFTGGPPDGSANFAAWQATASPASYKGLYTFALDLPPSVAGDPALPQGTGYGSLKIAAAGTYTVAGNLGDGSVFTVSGSVGSDGQCPLYTPLYSKTGSVHGCVKLELGGTATAWADTQVLPGPVDVSWGKMPDASAAGARNYPEGWPAFVLDVWGSKYPVPAPGQLVMNLGTDASANLTLDITAILEGSADFPMSVTSTGAGSISNADPGPFDSLTLTVTPSTGAFKGAFSITSFSDTGLSVKRSSNYNGLIVRSFDGATPTYRGIGWFLLADLPDLNTSPIPAANTTPILAGNASLMPPKTP